jgi:PIN domain nuclease of toxin-antitoxin system
VTALLDTHALLWFVTGDPRMSAAARAVIEDARTDLVFSVASAWEIVTKVQRRKLDVGEAPDRFVRRHVRRIGLRVLPIRLRHALRLTELPDHHRDPFDRLLVAQAQAESVPILTRDGMFARYGVRVIW